MLQAQIKTTCLLTLYKSAHSAVVVGFNPHTMALHAVTLNDLSYISIRPAFQRPREICVCPAADKAD